MTILTVLFHKSDDVRFTSDIDILHAIIDILFNGSSYIVQKLSVVLLHSIFCTM
mgnify:CR=1 FL=1